MKRFKRFISLLTSAVMLMSTLAIVPITAEAEGLSTLLARFMENNYWYDPEYLAPDSATASKIAGGRDFAWNSNVAWEENATQNGFPSSYGKVVRGIYNNPEVSSSFLNEGDVVMLGNRWNYLGGNPFGRSIEDYADTASLTIEFRMDNEAYLDCMYIYIKSYKSGVSGISAVKADTMYTADEIGTIKKVSIPISKFMSGDEDTLELNGGFDPAALCGCGMMFYQTPADSSKVRLVYDNAYVCNVLSPTDLHIGNSAADSLTLLWTASESEVSGYALYKDGEKLCTVGPDELSYTDSGLTLMEEHSYTVRAVDIYGAESNDSNTVDFMSAPVGRPENFKVQSSFDDAVKVQLTWDAPSYGTAVKYNIYRDDELLASVDGDKYEYIDSEVSENIEYTYYVKSEDADGFESMQSDVKKITASYIEKPTNFRAETNADTRTVSLTWDTVDNAVGYIVECNGADIADITENRGSFEHENLEYQKLYIYSVRAYNTNGTRSLPTDEVYVTIDNPEISNDAITLFDDSVNPDYTADIISPNDNVRAKFQMVSNDAAKGAKSFDLTLTQGTSLRHGLSFKPNGSINLSSMHNGMGVIQMYVKAEKNSVIKDLKVGLQCTSDRIDNVTYNDVITSMPLSDYVKDFGVWTYVEIPVSKFPEYGEYRDGTALRTTKFKFDKVTGINIFLQDINTEAINTVRFDEIKLTEYQSADLTAASTDKGESISAVGTNPISTSTRELNLTFAYKLNAETINNDTITLVPEPSAAVALEEETQTENIPLLVSYNGNSSSINIKIASPLKKETKYNLVFNGVHTANGAELKTDPITLLTSDEEVQIEEYTEDGFDVTSDSVKAKSGNSANVKLTVGDSAAKAYVTGGSITLTFPKKLLSVSEKNIEISPSLTAMGIKPVVSDGEIAIDLNGLNTAVMIGSLLADIDFKAAGSGADSMKVEGNVKVLSGTSEKNVSVKSEKAYVEIEKETSSSGSTGGSTSGGSTSSSAANREEGSGTRATTPPVPVTNPNPDGGELADASEVGWATEAINYLSKNGYVNGYDDNTFRPNNNVTRAEFVSMLVRVFDIKGGEKDAEFTDVNPDNWYYDAVKAAASSGIVEGYDGKFGASDTISRQDMCTMVYRAASIAGITLPDNYGKATFADENDISDYARDSISALQQAGIVNGVEDNKFNPSGLVTRAMAAKVLYGMLNVSGVKTTQKTENTAQTQRSAGISQKGGESAAKLKAFNIISDSEIYSDETLTGTEFLTWVMRLVGLGGVYSGEKAVSAARDLGYISDDDEFDADGALIYNEAVKIITEALGYGAMAKQSGGFPNGYISAGSKAGVLKGIKSESDGTISRSNAITLIDNALESDLMKITVSGDKVDSIEIKAGTNILNTYLDIEKYKCKIDSINRTAGTVTITADNETETFDVADNISIYSVIADDADVYVKDDKIVYIYYRGTVTVAYDFIEEVNGDNDMSKEYMTSGIKDIYLTNAEKKYTPDDNMQVYYEDKSIEWASAPLVGSFAQVTLKDGKIIEIQAYPLYEGGVIYHASFDMIKYRKGTDSNNVINKITDVKDLLIYLDGKPTDSIDELAPDMVFDYWLNDEEDKFIIVASSRSFKAELESYGSESVRASGSDYDVSTRYGYYAYNNASQRYEKCDTGSSIVKSYMGKTATFIIDDRKQLRYIRATDAAINENVFLGVVMKATYDDSGEILPANTQLKIYNVSDGTGEKVYDIADSVNKSPVSLDYAVSMAKNLDGKGFFQFTLNSDGKISKIEIPQYWGDEFTYTGSTDNATPSIIGKLYVKNSKLFAVYSDDGEFKVKELEWTADLKNASFGGSVQVISDYDIYNNPIPDYVMFARGIENLNHNNSTQILTDIEYTQDDKAIVTLSNLWGSPKYTVSKKAVENYRTPALVECTTEHLAGDQVRITKYRDLSGTPDEWDCDPFEEFKTGFYRADKILYGDDQVVQFQIDGNPTNVYKLSDYFYVLQCERGKKTVLTRQKGNTPLGYISPNDRVWFQTVSLSEYGIGVDFVIYEKNGIAPKE